MSHPVEETLLQYRFGTLDSETMAHVGEHLRTCSECTRLYARLGESVERLAAYDVESTADEAVLSGALERATTAFKLSGRREGAPAPEPKPAVAPVPVPRVVFTPPVSDRPEWPGFLAWLGVQSGAGARPLRLAALTALLLGATWTGGGSFYFNRHPILLDTMVAGDTSLQAGGTGLVAVQVLRDSVPVPEAAVSIALVTAQGRISLYEGRTGADGKAQASIAVPYTNEPSPQLEVTTRAGDETDVVTRPLELQRSYKVHLSTDKPLYQPGQTIHLRSLVMRSPRPEPASDKSVLFEVSDARGARLASQSVKVSSYGVASYDLELSDEVALGTWKLTATVEGVVADAQVDVGRYTLPKYKLSITPNKESYLAGERLKARVLARYFFGKPVAGAQVHALVLRGDGTVLADVKGKTDGDGTMSLEAELPAKLAAVGKPEPVVLQLEATDSAGQQERSERAVTVSRELLMVDVIPDGAPAPGLDSPFFVVTTTPDGRAIPCKVELTPMSQASPASIGQLGIGQLGVGQLGTRPLGSRPLGLIGPWSPPPSGVTRASSRNIGAQGTIDKDAVAKVLNSHLHEVSTCYERALLKSPGLAGKVLLEWQVTTSGSVGSARTKSSTMGNPGVESCLLSSLKMWKFPAGKGAAVTLTYPFMFNSVGFDAPPAALSPQRVPPPVPQPVAATPIGPPVTVRTGESGVGRFLFAPQSTWVRFEVKVEDAEGRRATREVVLSAPASSALTTDRAFYRPGETVRVDVQSMYGGQLELEARSEGRLIAHAPLVLGPRPNSSMAGTGSLILPAHFTGPLEVVAIGHQPGSPSPATTKGRQEQKTAPQLVPVSVAISRIVVAEPSGLTVKLSTDKPTYRPGEPATLRFTVTDSQGKPKVAALGLSVVDESLFALSSSQPSMVRAFFLVERALLTPHFGSNAGELLAATSWTAEQQVAGQLLLALNATASPAVVPRYFESTVYEKVDKLTAQYEWWSESARPVVLLGAFLLLLIIVVTIAGRLSPAAGALVLSAALLGVGWLRMPWQVQVFGGLFIAIAATVAATRGASEAPWSLLVLPAIAVVFSLITWTALPMEQLNPRSQNEVASAPKQVPLMKPKLEARQEEKKASKGLAVMKKMSAPEPAPTASSMDLLAAVAVLGPPAAEEPPRREVHVRQHFPETLYVNPQLVSDEKGVAELTLPLADSITAWRVSALASGADGKLGSMDAPLKVFQSFFVDLDVPVALVRGDEATVPVALYNYLETSQDVRLEVERQPWFELVGEVPKKVTLPPGGVDGRFLRIKVLEAGEHMLTVRADGASESDVVARELLVTESGREDSVTVSGTLVGGAPKKVALLVPEAAVGATQVMVKLFPSLAATALDGIEGTLGQPTGCFEQTSAATYPNVLVEEFLRREGRLTPELERRSARLLALGYQRLVGFEVDGGGFEWFGRAPANQVLSAYGLMEFSDMRRVFPVQPSLIERTQRFLLSRQKSDGSWDVDAQMIADGLFRSEHRGRVTVTAYIAWALAESGLREPALERAQQFLLENLEGNDDAYTLALVTASLARSGHAETARVAALLAKRAQRIDGLVVFKPAGATAYYGRGLAAEVETTALAGYALAKAGAEPKLVSGALDFLLARRQGHGAWPSTQGTTLALKALLAGTDGKAVPKVSVSINGAPAGTFELKDGKPKVLTLGDRARKGLNVVELSSDVNAPFLATATFTLPWRQKGDDDGKPLALSVEYGARKVDVGGVVPVDVALTYRGAEASGMALVELGVPAGLSPLPEDVEALRASGRVAKFQVAAGKVRLYLDRLSPGATLKFSLRFKATMAVTTEGAGSLAYLYYDPAVRASAPPVAVAVR